MKKICFIFCFICVSYLTLSQTKNVYLIKYKDTSNNVFYYANRDIILKTNKIEFNLGLILTDKLTIGCLYNVIMNGANNCNFNQQLILYFCDGNSFTLTPEKISECSGISIYYLNSYQIFYLKYYKLKKIKIINTSTNKQYVFKPMKSDKDYFQQIFNAIETNFIIEY